MLVKKAVAVLVLIPLFAVISFAIPSVNAASAVVMNVETNEVVFSVAAHERRSMASTTKIMTALVALESGRTLETVRITPEMTGADGTSIGLKTDYEVKLIDLLYGLMLESGNDAADAIAVYLAGSREDFAELMNKKAAEIGMKDTNFVTPSGLDDENHYTTAYDMALLGSYAVKNPAFRELCSTKYETVSFVKPDVNVTFSNHNRLLSSYSGAIGIKTGFTKKSGRCLVSAAERDGVCFVCVTLNDGDDWNDHRKMLDYAFEKVSTEPLSVKNTYKVSVQGSSVTSVTVKAQSEALYSYCGEKKQVTARVILPEFVYAPVKKGDVLGTVEYYLENRKIAEQNLVCQQNADSIEPSFVPKKGFLQRIFEKIKLIGEK
ncbi:MAG: D-alanyl-D-alanine carboxypeptidase family protein [Acutalibacteraceae bacterium]